MKNSRWIFYCTILYTLVFYFYTICDYFYISLNQYNLLPYITGSFFILNMVLCSIVLMYYREKKFLIIGFVLTLAIEILQRTYLKHNPLLVYAVFFILVLQLIFSYMLENKGLQFWFSLLYIVILVAMITYTSILTWRPYYGYMCLWIGYLVSASIGTVLTIFFYNLPKIDYSHSPTVRKK